MTNTERRETHQRLQELTIVALILVAAIACRNYLLASSGLSNDVSCNESTHSTITQPADDHPL